MYNVHVHDACITSTYTTLLHNTLCTYGTLYTDTLLHNLRFIFHNTAPY